MKISLSLTIASLLCVAGNVVLGQNATTQAAGKKVQIEPTALAEQLPARLPGIETVSVAPWSPFSAAGEKVSVLPWSPQLIAVASASLAGAWQNAPALPSVSAGAQTAGGVPAQSTEVSSISWAMSQIRKNRWDIVLDAWSKLPFDSEAVAAAAAAERKPEFRSDLIFGGQINPVGSAEEIKRRCEKILSLGFNSPIVPVRSLSGDWRKTYDAFFKAADGRIVPMAAICVREMNLADLLTLPEFAKRYECNFHSLIINYDLINGQVDDATDAAGFQQAIDKIALGMALIRRGSPTTFVWLGAGYYRNPDWRAWIKSFDAKEYSGILLTGESAVAACMYPQSAAQVQKSVVEQAGSVPVGLIDFKIPLLDLQVAKKDDRGLEQYELLRTSLKRAGIGLMHVGLTAP